jgi:hypothetical protein
MRAILSDHDIEGYFEILVGLLNGPDLGELWQSLHLDVLRLRDVGLADDSPDREIWTVCQAEQCVLITANRNLEDEDSLEQTLRDSVTENSLPVMTIASMDRFEEDPSYRVAVAWRLVECLMEMDRYRGTGRQFLP